MEQTPEDLPLESFLQSIPVGSLIIFPAPEIFTFSVYCWTELLEEMEDELFDELLDEPPESVNEFIPPALPLTYFLVV